MKWQPHYASGIPEIDQQHKTLLEASDQFRATLEAGLGEKTYDLFIDFLHDYAEAHFAEEERYMTAHCCPVAERNKREHAGFLRQMREAKARYHSEGFHRDSVMALLDKVDQWLDSHICRIDVQLKDVVGES